jgi:hypothetical protein
MRQKATHEWGTPRQRHEANSSGDREDSWHPTHASKNDT